VDRRNEINIQTGCQATSLLHSQTQLMNTEHCEGKIDEKQCYEKIDIDSKTISSLPLIENVKSLNVYH